MGFNNYYINNDYKNNKSFVDFYKIRIQIQILTVSIFRKS